MRSARSRACKSGISGRITIGAGPAWLRRLLPSAVGHFCARGHSSGQDRRRLRRGVLQDLASRRDRRRPGRGAEFGGVRRPRRPPAHVRRTGRRLPAGTPARGSRESCASRTFSTARWALPPRATRSRRRFDSLFISRELPPPNRWSRRNPGAFLLSLLTESDALTYTTRRTLEQPDAAGLVSLNVPELAAERVAGFITRKGQTMSATLAVLFARLPIVGGGRRSQLEPYLSDMALGRKAIGSSPYFVARSPAGLQSGETMRLVFLLFDFAQPPHAGRLWRDAGPHPELRPPRPASRHLRPPLCRQPALHAGAARHADRPPELPAPELGAARAVRQFLSRSCCATAGIYSHLITDHFHYFEDGGATYHNRYDSYEFVRGQEGDPWKAMVQPHWERLREMYHERQYSEAQRDYFRHNIVNREFIREEKDFPSVQCFAQAFEFLDRNRDADNWLLQIETFDPHEPFHAPAALQASRSRPAGTARSATGRATAAWTSFREECEELRANYYAVVSLCDFLLGRAARLFRRSTTSGSDTALVLTTDHGFLLGEHDFWAKNRMNLYEEITHIPLFVYHPDHSCRRGGTRRSALTQTIDLAPTFLDLFGAAALRPRCRGTSLLPLLRGRRRSAEGLSVRLFRRRRERDRRPLHVPPLPGRPALAGDLQVHGDADAPLGAFQRRGAVARDALPSRSRSRRACRS